MILTISSRSQDVSKGAPGPRQADQASAANGCRTRGPAPAAHRKQEAEALTASQKKTGSANGKTEPVNREKFNLKQAFAA